MFEVKHDATRCCEGIDIHVCTCPGCSIHRFPEGKLDSHWFHYVLSSAFIN